MNYNNAARTVPFTAQQFSDARLRPKYSVPVEHVHMGYPNVFRMPYRKSHTAGQITGSLLEFPQDMFPRTRFSSANIATDAVWVRSYDENTTRTV
jgi:hypothetical protein